MATEDQPRRVVVPTVVAEEAYGFGFADDERFWLEIVECEDEVAASHWDTRRWSGSPYLSRSL